MKLRIFALITLAVAMTSCAEYPLTLSVQSEYGKASYSAKGIEIEIQK
jgi:hypothetical protein